jgi:hypothetical protein
MLKEIFVIADGVLFFHYSVDPDITNSDDTILSSGLLTAIQNFSEGARSDALESFNMENEYFLFRKFPDSSKTLVGVFETRTPQQLARNSLIQVFNEVIDTNLPDEKGFIDLNTTEKQELKKRIGELISQLFGTKEDAAYVSELLGSRTDIPLAFLLDAYEKKAIAIFAKPKPLFKDQQVKDFFLLNTSLNTTISKLNLSGTLKFSKFKSLEYVIAVVFCGKSISVASGSMNSSENDVTNAALKMCHYDSIEKLIGSSNEEVLKTRARISQSGDITHLKGEKLPTNAAIFLLTLINNVNRFFTQITRRKFDEFTFCLLEDDLIHFKIMRHNDTEEFLIEVSNQK